MTAPTTVAIRMYHVGFGDAFRITVVRDGVTWRMLLDCGVHSQGMRQPIEQSVNEIIEDLTADCAPGSPHLDVVAATHHHADHISGFAVQAWEKVTVGEVWLPFVEDDTDTDAAGLKAAQVSTAHHLQGLVAARVHQLSPEARDDPHKWPPDLAAALAFAVNSSGNADATDRLIGRNGKRFATPGHPVRYLPKKGDPNRIQVAPDVVVHVLGPSRDPGELKRMDPPAGDGWHAFGTTATPTPDDGAPPLLFLPKYAAPLDQLPRPLRDSLATLDLDELTNDDGVLAAASILEQSVNNTSLFLVLDVAGSTFVFPGDSQYGAWQHVLNDPPSLALVSNAVFYKIGHHGSQNATPQRFIDQIWANNGYAMLPWWLVKAWQATIPFGPLLKDLDDHHHPTIRQDSATPVSPDVTVIDGRWSEVILTVPATGGTDAGPA